MFGGELFPGFYFNFIVLGLFVIHKIMMLRTFFVFGTDVGVISFGEGLFVVLVIRALLVSLSDQTTVRFSEGLYGR